MRIAVLPASILVRPVCRACGTLLSLDGGLCPCPILRHSRARGIPVGGPERRSAQRGLGFFIGIPIHSLVRQGHPLCPSVGSLCHYARGNSSSGRRRRALCWNARCPRPSLWPEPSGTPVHSSWICVCVSGIRHRRGPANRNIFFSCLSILLLLPVSISGIGVREVFSIFFFSDLDASPEQAVAFSWLLLSLSLVVALIGAGVHVWGTLSPLQPSSEKNA